MELKRDAYESDKLQLTSEDIESLKRGEVLSAPGLKVILHIADVCDNIKDADDLPENNEDEVDEELIMAVMKMVLDGQLFELQKETFKRAMVGGGCVSRITNTSDKTIPEGVVISLVEPEDFYIDKDQGFIHKAEKEAKRLYDAGVNCMKDPMFSMSPGNHYLLHTVRLSKGVAIEPGDHYSMLRFRTIEALENMKDVIETDLAVLKSMPATDRP